MTARTIQFSKADDIVRDDVSGIPISWRTADDVTTLEFNSYIKYMQYVDEHITSLHDWVAFSGSASLTNQANAYLLKQLRSVGIFSPKPASYRPIKFRTDDWSIINSLANTLSDERGSKVSMPAAVVEAVKFYQDNLVKNS